jgi:transposase
MDLWAPYKKLAEELIPNANITVTADRFHVMKQVNDELDARRRAEKNAAKSLENESEKERITEGLNQSKYSLFKQPAIISHIQRLSLPVFVIPPQIQ